MNKPSLVAYVSDFYLQLQIEALAKSKKLDFYFATYGESLSQLVKNLSAFVLIADLTEPNSDWIFRNISEIMDRDSSFRVIVFISDFQEDVKGRAEKYGCYIVFTKSELLNKLPNSIERILRKTL